MIGRSVRNDDAEARLTRALARHAAAAGVTVDAERCRSRPWSSATFQGVQLHLTLVAAPAAEARRWLDALADAELAMRGHVAMPAAVDAITDRGDALAAEIAVLVLVDG